MDYALCVSCGSIMFWNRITHSDFACGRDWKNRQPDGWEIGVADHQEITSGDVESIRRRVVDNSVMS
jgi:hypothetical protein